MTDSYRGSWVNPGSYATYEERRQFVTPALNELVSEVIDELFEADDVILEVGAGAGALRRYAGESADQLTWVETEHFAVPLTMTRAFDTQKTVVALPDLPFKDGALDGIISLGVLDTLSNSDLSGTAKEAARTLKTGGVIVHLLDMSPDYVAEIKNARTEGLFPLIFTGDDENATIGIHYVALKDLARRVGHLPIDQSVKNVFGAIVDDPEKHIAYVNRTGILQLLGGIAKKHDMVVKTSPNWLGKLGAKLSTEFENAGLTVVRNEIVTKQLSVDETHLPANIRGLGATDVVRKQGSVEVFKDTDALVLPGRIRVRADSQLFVAKK